MLISALETINRGRGSGRARGREFERELGQQNQDHRSPQSFLIKRSLRKRRVPERPPEAAQSWVTHRVVQGLHVYVQRTPVIFCLCGICPPLSYNCILVFLLGTTPLSSSSPLRGRADLPQTSRWTCDQAWLLTVFIFPGHIDWLRCKLLTL